MIGRIPTDPENSVLTEAHGLVHGDRNADYDHPYTDYSRSVAIFNAWTGIELTPSQGIKFMRCVKMSREISNPKKRDNYTDGAGYIECDRMVNDFITPIPDIDPDTVLDSVSKMLEMGYGIKAIAIAHKMPESEIEKIILELHILDVLIENDERKVAGGNDDKGSPT